MNITEEQQHELETTSVSRTTAIVMSCLFVLILVSVPFLQIVLDDTQEETAFMSSASPLGSVYYSHIEETLENASSLVQTVQPKVQGLLAQYGGFGNDKVTLGRKEWLFYEPGLRYVYGPDFTRRKGPLAHEAIIQLHRDLERLGIHLVVVPVPDKAMVQPWHVSGRFDGFETLAPLNNKGYARFLRLLQEQGVDIFDVIPPDITKGEIHYLSSDTHWKPHYMKSTSKKLAGHLVEKQLIPSPRRDGALELYKKNVAGKGDLVRMLKFGDEQTQYPPFNITIERVRNRWSGDTIASDPNADIMLLGDSFTNIYSSPDMGWGEGAGFAEHLSYELNRPIDTIALNGGGDYVVRQALLRPENLERLAHKKVVVYQFSMRDLLGGDWRTVALPQTLPATGTATPLDSTPRYEQTRSGNTITAPTLDIVARVTKTSNVPRPHTTPYEDCVSYMALAVEKVINGQYEASEILGIFHAMEDNIWLPPAGYKIGDRILMALVPKKDMPERFRNMQATDDTALYTRMPFFVMDSRKLGNSEVIESVPRQSKSPDKTKIANTVPPAAEEEAVSIALRSVEVAKARRQAMEKTKAAILNELELYGDNDWSAWFDKLTPFRADLKAKIRLLKPNYPNATGPRHARSTVLSNDGQPLLFEFAPDFFLDYLYDVYNVDNWTDSRKIVSLLKKTSDWFALRGIDFIIVPVPRMTETYPDTISEKTPADLRVAPHMRRLIYALLENDVEVIDVLPAFLEHQQADKRRLFFTTDPHWTQAGNVVAAQQLYERLLRYEFIQNSIQDEPIFNTVFETQVFEGLGIPALSPAQLALAKPFLGYRVLSVHGKGQPIPKAAWLANDSPVMVFGDSFVHFPSDNPVSGTNLLATLATAINRPVTDYSNDGQRLNEPLTRLLRDPSTTSKHKVAIYVLNNTTIARPNWVDLPQPIEDELNKARE